MIDSFFLVIKNGDFCENSRHVLYDLHVFVEEDAVVTPIKSSWPEETKAVAEPESLGWSPRNAGIVSIGCCRIAFF